MTTTTATPKAGDILRRSWGYDQTNIDYYRVTGLTPSGKSVRVQAIGTELVEARGPYGNKVRPDPAKPLGPARTKRWNDGWKSGQYRVKITSYSSAFGPIDPASIDTASDSQFGH